MRCAVITPIGPGHERLYKECRGSVQAAIQSSLGPFKEVSSIAIDDTSGKQGRSAARNEAVRKASSDNIEWLFFLDADDLLIPQAFEFVKEFIHVHDAIWGSIIEVFAGSNQVSQRIPQILTLSNIKELLMFDPYITLQMGHFVRTKVALENPFNEIMDTGEDFDYYLRVWNKFRCIKIKEPFFINRRGMHSTGPKSANGRDWRSAVEQQVDKYRKMCGLEHMNIEMLQIMNNKALEFAHFAKESMISDSNNFLQLSKQLPYYGYYTVDCYECPPFLMLSHNDDLVVNSIMWTGSYEPVSLSLWSRLAGNANLVFDIGAYSGIYGIAAARRNSNCAVVCIEPLDMNFARIRENIILNSFHNISVLPIAISNVNGEININLYSNESILAPESSTKNSNRDPVSVKKVHSITIDTLVQLNSIRNVDLVKIDVNGAEIDVIEGMRKTIETFRPDLIISVPNNEIAIRLAEIFDKFEYNYFEIKEDSRIIRKTNVITSGTNLLDSNRLITVKNVDELQQIFQIDDKYGNICIIPGVGTIDYKK